MLEIEKVRVSPSSSLALTEPIDCWFSDALKEAEEDITGATSLILLTLIVISFVTVAEASVRDRVRE